MEVMDKFVKYNENSHGNQALIHLRSNWKGDRLEITRVVDCFFFYYYYTFDLLWLFYIRCFVLSSQRKNQIFETLGILLHYILGESYRRMPCLLSTVFVTYFLEIREET